MVHLICSFGMTVSRDAPCQTCPKGKGRAKNIPGMFLKKIKKITLPDEEIYLYFPNFSKEVSQQKDRKTYKKFVIIGKLCTNILGISQKKFRKIYHPGQDISLYLPNFSNEVSQLTDWQTYKQFVIIGQWRQHIHGMFQKKSEKYIIQDRRYPYIGLIQPTNGLTDIHKICRHLE